MKKFFKKTKGGGFTLVETLVAISIFTVSILGLMSVLASGIADTTYAKQKIVASYLAQEGIEYIRNMRDTFVLYSYDSQTGWNSFNTKIAGDFFPLGHTVCASTPNGCYINADSLNYTNPTQPIISITLPTCNSSNCSDAPLLYDSATGKYGYTISGTTANSGFTRQIKITQVSANEVQISSTVYWTQGSGSYNISFSEHLFNNGY